MIYLKYFKNFCLFSIILIAIGCSKFERTEEIDRLLKEEVNLNIDTLDNFNVFILQDQICGACTDDILSFIFSLDHKNSLVIVSNSSQILERRLNKNIGESKVFIDKTRLIDKYGLRYAKDLVISYNHGKLRYWSYITEENFHKIRKNVDINLK